MIHKRYYSKTFNRGYAENIEKLPVIVGLKLKPLLSLISLKCMEVMQTVQWDSVHWTYLCILPRHSLVQQLTGSAQQWDQTASCTKTKVFGLAPQLDYFNLYKKSGLQDLI